MTAYDSLMIGGANGRQVKLDLAMANRHGLIAGATGTGKTVTLQVLAEGFSRAGVPVFMADVKGDLSGIAASGVMHRKISERVEAMSLTGYQQRPYPSVFWDIYGEKGHWVRTTVSDFGPLLLSSFLDLNATQSGVLHTAFRAADEAGMLLLDVKDLQAVLTWVKDERASLERVYGGISPASIAAIQRQLNMLGEQGGIHFFGEPALVLDDLMKCDFTGNGVVNVLEATRLIRQPRLYAIFLLWLISELFEQLPEVGDVDRPRLVFFFDEAHLLFDSAPKVLLDKIEQVVRLIRSKGIGVYFISQSPADIPEAVLGQLGNRVQHALRAFTPNDQKAVRVAARTFRANPEFDTESVITQLGVGEALVSILDKHGVPTPVERVLIAPPESRIGPLTEQERREVLSRSPWRGRYDEPFDRDSAWEELRRQTEQKQPPMVREKSVMASGRQRQSVMEAAVKSAARSIGSSLGRQIMRGILGSLTRR